MNLPIVKKLAGAALSLIGLAVVADGIIVALIERAALCAICIAPGLFIGYFSWGN